MAKKVYEIQVDDEKLTNTKKSKVIESKKSKSEKEVENFGIEQINNTSAKSKVKSTSDVGFEKNVTKCAKKSVKSKVHMVEDYFDFSFRKEEPKAEIKAEAVLETKVVKTKKSDVPTKTEISKKPASICKMKAIDEIEPERRISVVESCERILDEEANRIVCIARMGTLFG